MTTLLEVCEKARALNAAVDRLRARLEQIEARLEGAGVRVRVEVALSNGGKLAWERRDARWGLYVRLLGAERPSRPEPLLNAPRKVWCAAALALPELLDALSAVLVEGTTQCEASAEAVEMAIHWLNRSGEGP